MKATALALALLALAVGPAGLAAAEEPTPQPAVCEMKHKDVDPIRPETGTVLDDVRIRVYHLSCA